MATLNIELRLRLAPVNFDEAQQCFVCGDQVFLNAVALTAEARSGKDVWQRIEMLGVVCASCEGMVREQIEEAKR